MATYEVNPVSKTRTKLNDIGRFLYNKDDGACLGRTPASWGLITAFYLVYYMFLSGFFAAMVMAFFTTIDDDVPKLQDWDSLIKYNPGMGYRPQPDVEYTLVQFNIGNEKSYSKYQENLDKFFEDYSEEKQSNMLDCDPDDPNFENLDPNKACKFPLSVLGDECTPGSPYGYEEGRPCVLLKLNKLFNWTPEPIVNTTVPTEVQGRYNPNYIGVSCDGVTEADKDNIGPVKYYPEQGFSNMYFPYHNQDGYLQPIVMVQFLHPNPGTMVQVWCKAWAANIYHHRNDRAGSVNFELFAD